MLKITLDSRLSAVASLVRNGSVVADIGTDHAYLPSYLVQNNICPSAIAGDVRVSPLESARKTVLACELEDKIRTVLSDGLDEIKKGECTDIVLAGMGGELIVTLLERTDWVFDSSIRIIAQPMSHHEDVRRFFFENGFEIVGEKCSKDSKHNYCVIAAEYTGKETEYTPAGIYVGTIANDCDDCSIEFLDKQYARLYKKYEALMKSGHNEETDSLKILLDDFVRLRGGNNGKS